MKITANNFRKDSVAVVRMSFSWNNGQKNVKLKPIKLKGGKS